MTKEKIKLLRRIFTILGLEEVPKNMVSRRVTIFHAFEENKTTFHHPEFVSWFGNVLGKGKSFEESALTAASVFSFINNNQDLWSDAFEFSEEKLITEESDSELSEQLNQIIQRNNIQPRLPKDTPFLFKLLKKLALSDRLSYPAFEKEILNYLEDKTNLQDNELVEEAIKAYAQIVYKEDTINIYRFLFEEFKENKNEFEELGIFYRYPNLTSKLGNISRAMDSVYDISTFSTGLFELRRLVSIINRIGEASLSEEEVTDLFTSYLSGGIDEILLNPPENCSYLVQIEKTIDYNFQAEFSNLFPNLTFSYPKLTPIFNKFMNILLRIKIVEWSRNVPIGKELTILDLISEIQNELIGLKNEKSEKLIPIFEMFQKTNQNILELVTNYYSRKLSLNFILRLKKGGIEKELMDSFRNLGSPSKDLGLRINDIKISYQAYYPFETWKKEFYHEFILGVAAKGLGSAQKQTVRERVQLLVKDDIKHSRSSIITKKVSPELIFKKLKIQVPFMKPTFTTPDEAQIYFDKAFLSIKTALNQAWIKKILKAGFKLYIEQPVTKAWTDELEDLSRELIRYAKDLSILKRSLSEINELVLESLREALSDLHNIKKSQKDQEALTLLLKLPEIPLVTDKTSVEKYLDLVFQFCKPIINTLLNRKVEEEIERKTFIQEVEERVISLENKVLDWYAKSCSYYNEVIKEPLSLEKTINPNDVLLKTIYGGTFYLIEEKMDSLFLNRKEKISKAIFLIDLFSNQALALRKAFSKLDLEFNYKTIIDFILQQIELWESVFMLRGFLVTLEANMKEKTEKGILTGSETNIHIIEKPEIRGLIARDLVIEWIKKWANSIIDLLTFYVEMKNRNEIEKKNLEQELFDLLFIGTGRNDIRNFIVPLILGNIREVLGFESCFLSQEFAGYSHDVFPETVSCDAQLSMHFLAENWKRYIQEHDTGAFNEQLSGSLDYIAYLSTTITSCRQFIGERELKLSDVVKKATGLSLAGLKLQTIVFQFGKKEVFSAMSYAENPFEGSEVTGLTLELISKENIPIANLNPLCQNASEVLAGLIERKPQNIADPDPLFKSIIHQLLEEAKLFLLKDYGSLKDILREKLKTFESTVSKDISRTTLRVSSAFTLKFSSYCRNSKNRFLAEEVSYYGKVLYDFGLFLQLIVPFFEPGESIKEQLINDYRLKTNLGINRREDLLEEIIFPSLAVFDDNGNYKVVFGTVTSSNILNIVIADEDSTSKMGLRTINYLLKTRTSFEEFVSEMGLFPLPELNRSIPLNKINVIKEGKLDFQLIKNIQLGAI